jgi:hypothetical protein
LRLSNLRAAAFFGLPLDNEIGRQLGVLLEPLETLIGGLLTDACGA